MTLGENETVPRAPNFKVIDAAIVASFAVVAQP